MTDRRTGTPGDEWERAVDVAATYVFRLYIVGDTLRSRRAIENARRLCEEYLPGRYELEIIDTRTNPESARQDQIVASPTLVRELPLPLRRLIGDLSDAGPEAIGLDLHTAGPRGSHTSVRDHT